MSPTTNGTLPEDLAAAAARRITMALWYRVLHGLSPEALIRLGDALSRSLQRTPE